MKVELGPYGWQVVDHLGVVLYFSARPESCSEWIADQRKS